MKWKHFLKTRIICQNTPPHSFFIFLQATDSEVSFSNHWQQSRHRRSSCSFWWADFLLISSPSGPNQPENRSRGLTLIFLPTWDGLFVHIASTFEQLAEGSLPPKLSVFVWSQAHQSKLKSERHQCPSSLPEWMNTCALFDHVNSVESKSKMCAGTKISEDWNSW